MRSRPASVSAALLAAAALLAGGCGGGEEEPGPSERPARTTAATKGTAQAGGAKKNVEVPIASFRYVPKTVRVQAGGTVTWRNKDRAPHTSTAVDKSFNTGTLRLEDSKKVRFTEPGKYRYYCIFHRFMEADVIVE